MWQNVAMAADWPAWRYDAGRTAATPASLPDTLHLQWIVQYSARDTVWDDPLNDDLMRYDRVFEPIVVGQTLLMGFNDTDKLVALDTESGREKWQFYASGPLRMPPVAEAGRVYFVSDDGWLYCVRVQDGTLIWKHRGGPSGRKILGNQRLISAWPARGAPVLHDGMVYFAASIWPLMGTAIYALDAATGRVQWVNDGTSAQYIDQPHNYPAFAGVAPQGNFVVSEDALLVPGGRSVPACFDRETGQFRYFHLAKYGKYGGSWVFAQGNRFFAHIRGGEYLAYDLETGLATDVHAHQPVLTDRAFYGSGRSASRFDWNTPEEAVWKVDVDATGDLIRAGSRLYAAGNETISAIEDRGGEASVAWQKRVSGKVERLLAADGKLFAVTLDGRLMAFGKDRPDDGPARRVFESIPLHPGEDAADRAAAILSRANVNEGYALFYGVGDGSLLEALAMASDLQLVAVDPDTRKIETLRRKYDAAGLYGDRIALLVGDIHSVPTPPYMSSLTVVHDYTAAGFDEGSSESVARIFESLRPYGGTAFLAATDTREAALASSIQKANLQRAILLRDKDFTRLVREGALPGAGQWTHQYGNAANTVKSDDQRVKLPLGVLWFGGSSNMDVLPRHGHGPPEQIVGGRLFIEGMDCLSARDVYTGRVLWKVTLERLNNFGVYYDETYENLPLTLKYNQVHIPGANIRGTNFVATADRVYVIEEDGCRMLDAATGETMGFFSLGDGSDPAPDWAYLAVRGDTLIGGAEFADLSRRLGLPHEKDPNDRKSKWRFTDFDKAASHAIVAMDRFSGEQRWRTEARFGFLHNAIAVADGKLFCLDKLPRNVEKSLARRGRPASSAEYRLLALDLHTGRPIWHRSQDVFGSWLSYSQKHDLLLQSTRPSRDTVRDEAGTRMIVYDADSGRIVWDKMIEYDTPPILHGDDIITGGQRLSLLTGETRYRIDPLTGVRRPWTYVSTKGCNYPIASENLLTFRSSAAAFYDLLQDGGTGHFGGFKSGCTSNLIAADGVLNAPEYTRTCRCSFQNQTSLALVHMPDLELWTHNDYSYERGRIEQVGINFGAPGDRRSEEGVLWMDFPSVGGPSPDIAVDVDREATYFRHHMSRVDGDGIPWVAASGIEGTRKVVVHLGGATLEPDGGHPVANGAQQRPPVRRYTVRLLFAEPNFGTSPGERIFDVALQGEIVLREFDVAAEAGQAHRGIVKEFTGIRVADELQIDFTPSTQLGSVLSGVEVYVE